MIAFQSESVQPSTLQQSIIEAAIRHEEPAELKPVNGLVFLTCVLLAVALQLRAYSGGPAAFMGARNARPRTSGARVSQFDLTLNYGNVPLGQTLTKSQILTTNCGADFCFPIDYDTALISGTDSAEFTLVNDTCSGSSRPTGSSCSMSVRFTPSLPGVRSAYLYLDSTAGNAPLILSLTGSGTVQLPIDRISQGTLPWGTQVYDHSTKLIKNLGCGLTSLAMALNYVGVATDPGALNTTMVEGNGYDGEAVSWDPAVRAATDGERAFYARVRYWNDPAAAQFLNAALAAGFPVVVGVKIDAKGKPHHFVLVTGFENGQYMIQDPGDVGKTTLADYGGHYVTRGIVVPRAPTLPGPLVATGAPSDVSGLTVAVPERATVLLTDSQGRRTGFDSNSNQECEEIPSSAHLAEGLDDDEDGTPAAHFSDSVNVFQPASGTYRVKVAGDTPGIYSVVLHPFRSDGTSQSPFTFQGISGPGGTLSLQVQLSVLPGGSTTIIRQAGYTSTLQDIAACRAQGLITKQSIAKGLSKDITKASTARKDTARQAALRKYLTALAHGSRYISPAALAILQQDGLALQAGNIAP